METPATTDFASPDVPSGVPWELIVNIAENLLQSRQYASLVSLLVSSRYYRDALGLVAKRFVVVRGDDVEELEERAPHPGTEHVE
jgi:hypothetical protein